MKIRGAILVVLALMVFGGCSAISRSIGGFRTEAARAPTAATTLGLNLRKGPGMGHRILTTLPKGTRVEVLGSERSWRRVKLVRNGKKLEGWVSAKYLSKSEPPRPREPEGKAPVEVAARPRPAPEPKKPAVEKKAPPAARRDERTDSAVRWHEAPPEPAKRTARKSEPKAPVVEKPAVREPEEPRIVAVPKARPTPLVVPGPSVVESTGYTADVRPLRDALARGRFADVEARFALADEKARRDSPDRVTYASRVGLFPLLERGAVEVDRGRVEQAAETFSNAETILAALTEARPTESRGWLGLFERRAAAAPESASEAGDAFERIWTLTYHALALLLAGDPEAVTVAERAVAAQDLERVGFEETRAAAERELARERDRGDAAVVDAVEKSLAREYERSAARAEAAKSAFTNPFPHYVAAIALEVSARANPELRARAREHYEKALAMAPGNELFRDAVTDLSEQGEDVDDRVVHVLLAEGFAPEKGALRYELPLASGAIDVRLPIRSPVPSGFAAAALAVDPTEEPLTLSEIVDVEATSLRFESGEAATRALAVLRAANAGTDMPAPETAGWMTLPARFHAARLRLPKESMTLAIGTFDASRARIGGTRVLLDPEADALIYARSAGPILTIRSTSPDWFRGPDAAVARSAPIPEP